MISIHSWIARDEYVLHFGNLSNDICISFISVVRVLCSNVYFWFEWIMIDYEVIIYQRQITRSNSQREAIEKKTPKKLNDDVTISMKIRRYSKICHRTLILSRWTIFSEWTIFFLMKWRHLEGSSVRSHLSNLFTFPEIWICRRVGMISYVFVSVNRCVRMLILVFWSKNENVVSL